MSIISHRLIKVVMPKIIQLIRTGIARQNSSHIKFRRRAECAFNVLRENTNLFTKSLWFHVSIRK